MSASPDVVPLRVRPRRLLREQALDAAQVMLVDRGWEQLTVRAVAAATGVSRPTFYKEFANKHALGEALVRRETERFLAGVAEVLGRHPDDALAGLTEAVRYTLTEAADNPLLHAVLTSTRAGDDSLLPLLTTRSGPLLEAATAALTSWFAEHFPDLDDDAVAESADALVRLVVSHLVLPAGDPAATARRLARLATGYLRV